jgi:hypothetical protein
MGSADSPALESPGSRLSVTRTPRNLKSTSNSAKRSRLIIKNESKKYVHGFVHDRDIWFVLSLTVISGLSMVVICDVYDCVD